MDPAALIPAPDTIPVPWLWLQLLLTLTAFAHLVLMNVLLGPIAIALALAIDGDPATVPLRQGIGRRLPVVMAFTINLGVAPLLFVQALYGQFFYTSTILMGSYWLAIVPMLLAVYVSLYLISVGDGALGRGAFLFGLAACLLLGIAFLFTNNVSLMQMPASWVGHAAARSGWQINLVDAALLPRYLHFTLSALALGGLAIAVYHEIGRRRGDRDGGAWIALGCRCFTLATLPNFAVGVWFLGAVPLSAHDPASPTGQLFYVLLLGSVFAAVKALVHAEGGRALPAAGWALLTTFLMTLARDLLRLGALTPHFRPDQLPVAGQYGPLLLFLLILLGVVVLLRWLWRIAGLAMEVQP